MSSPHDGRRVVQKPASPKARQSIHGTYPQSRSETLDDNDHSTRKLRNRNSLKKNDMQRRQLSNSYTSDEIETNISEDEPLEYSGDSSIVEQDSISRKRKTVSHRYTSKVQFPDKKVENNAETLKKQPYKSLLLCPTRGCVVIALCIIVVVCFMYRNTNDTRHIHNDSIDRIQRQFNKQDSDTWDQISCGINDVVNQTTKLSIFILISNESDTLNCLAISLGKLCSEMLGTNGYLKLTPENIGSDTGEVLSTFKDKILTNKVVVVENLLNINAKALQAFHNLCDRENPLVEQTVYIITILSESYAEKRLVPFVEAIVTNKLSGSMDEDKIAPLVTRITDGAIIEVRPEQHMAECLLNQ